MRVGDLVTLSTRCLLTSPMWKWHHRVWREKKNLIGIITKIEDNPFICEDTSENQKLYYYVKWMNDGPNGRWGVSPYAASYFWRKDLKHVK